MLIMKDMMCVCVCVCVCEQPKDDEPVVRVLTAQPIVVVDNHFRLPIGKTDMLKAPDHFPCPVYRYTLSEISIVWSMYGGRDFESSCTYRRTTCVDHSLADTVQSVQCNLNTN